MGREGRAKGKGKGREEREEEVAFLGDVSVADDTDSAHLSMVFRFIYSLGLRICSPGESHLRFHSPFSHICTEVLLIFFQINKKKTLSHVVLNIIYIKVILLKATVYDDLHASARGVGRSKCSGQTLFTLECLMP